MSRKLFTALAVFATALATAAKVSAQGKAETLASHRALLGRYCVTCHNERLVAGRGGAPSPLVSQLRAIGLTLDTLDLAAVGARPEVWEKVVRKLRGGMMPPAGRPRPVDEATLAFTAWLEDELDRAAAEYPDPGRTAPLHRLNRAEYRNAVRDLLALEVDVDALLPADDSSYGFDNMGTALRMSQSLLERYLAAAKIVSRLAVGSPPPAVVGETYRLATDMQQQRPDGRAAVRHRGGSSGTRRPSSSRSGCRRENIDDDILLVARGLARRDGSSIGAVISELARKALSGGASDGALSEGKDFYGFRPLPKRGKPVTNDLINRLRDDGPY